MRNNLDHASGQRGSALAMVMLFLFILTGMGVALLVLSESGLKLNRADQHSKKSFYLAEAALEEGRMALFQTNLTGSFDDDLLAASGGTLGNNVIDFDPAALRPTFDSYGTLTGFAAGVGDDTALVAVKPHADGAYAAFLTNDPLDLTTNVVDGNGRIMITGVGAGPRRSLEVVQAIMEYEPVLISAPPAAVSLLGPDPDYSPGSSAAKLYSGDDCSGSGVPGLFVPAVGVVGSATVTDLRTELGKPTYESGGLAPELTVADLTDTAEPTVGTALDTAWTECKKVKAMIEGIRDAADVVCLTSSCSLPPSAPGRVVFVDADFSIGPGLEEGTLVVTGVLELIGNLDWNGVIYAIGEGHLIRSGGGGGGGSDVSGALVVADIAGPDDVYGTSDDCTGGVGGYGRATFDTRGGGNSTVVYCSTDINNAEPHQLYKIVDFLQR